MDTMPQRSEVMERVGKKLRELRNERFLSRSELAEKAGVSPATIATLEERNHPAQRRTIRKLADALGVDPHELVESEE
jgi:transcriptional regulator with XRE-family HTH domain